MAQGHSNVRQVGDRIEVLLGELRSIASPEVGAKVEEVVGLLVELYGAGLERILEVVNEDADAAAPLLKRFTDDKFIESLLVLHGLHPVDVDTRIEAALDQARPYLGSHAGGVEYLGVDDGGVAHLKLEGSCHGCPSSTVTVKLTLEQAIAEAAPEVIRVEVEGVAEAPTGPSQSLIQIQTRPGAGSGSNSNGKTSPRTGPRLTSRWSKAWRSSSAAPSATSTPTATPALPAVPPSRTPPSSTRPCVAHVAARSTTSGWQAAASTRPTVPLSISTPSRCSKTSLAGKSPCPQAHAR